MNSAMLSRLVTSVIGDVTPDRWIRISVPRLASGIEWWRK